MNLIVDAEDAEAIAEAFSKFKTHVPDQAPDITASISELYAIGSALRDIDKALDSAEYSRNFPLIEKDLELVCSSLRDTLEDVFEILGRIGNGSPVLTAGMYRQNWKDITLFFIQNRRITLRTRLEIYRAFIAKLPGIIKRFASPHEKPSQYLCSRFKEGLPKHCYWTIFAETFKDCSLHKLD